LCKGYGSITRVHALSPMNDGNVRNRIQLLLRISVCTVTVTAYVPIIVELMHG